MPTHGGGVRGHGPLRPTGNTRPTSRIALCRGRDETKDQSYVLFGIQRQLLGRLKFPIGEYRKEEIRQIAERLRLPVAAKRDSQEICFVPDQDHARFIRQYRGAMDTVGRNCHHRRHGGRASRRVRAFTVGQRKGLRSGLRRAALRGADRARLATAW